MIARRNAASSDDMPLTNFPATAAALGITPREERRYSLSRVLAACADGKPLTTGYEAEVDQQCRRTYGRDPGPGRAMVPTGLRMTRDLTVATAAAGGYLVGTDNLGGSFIDLLRKRLVLGQLGATVMPGLTGNVTIPKQVAAATANWLANEATAITESQQTIGQLMLTPKTVGAYTEYSRQLLLQSNPSVDAMIANDLSKVLALAIDSAALTGTGTGGQPTGLLNTAGIGSVTGTTLGYAGLIEFQTDTADALEDASRAGYLATPAVAALLAQRQRFTSTDSPLWEGNIRDGTIAGFRAMTSNQVPASTMIFGSWEHLLLGEWGYLEIAVDPYTGFKSGIIGCRALQSVDVGVRQAGSFSVATSIS